MKQEERDTVAATIGGHACGMTSNTMERRKKQSIVALGS